MTSRFEASAVDVLARPVSTVETLGLLLVAMRPWEWVKNGFLFAALLFSNNFLNPSLAGRALIAFVLYCLAAGGIYLINDVWDREEDRLHPQKRARPVTSGALAVPVAVGAAALLLVAAVSGSFLLSAPFGAIAAGYVLLMIAYSRWLKHLVILDVFAIAVGFVLRVVAGAVVIDVRMSHWLLICTMLLALFLGFSKRRHELTALAGEASRHRRVLAEYSPLFLDMMIGVVTSATVVAYTLYTVSEETVRKVGTDGLLLTVPFVLYGIFRYLYLVYHRNHGGSPAQTLLTDLPLIVNVVLWGLASAAILAAAGGWR